MRVPSSSYCGLSPLQSSAFALVKLISNTNDSGLLGVITSKFLEGDLSQMIIGNIILSEVIYLTSLKFIP